MLEAVSVTPPEISTALKEWLRSNFVFLSDSRGTPLDVLDVHHRNCQAARNLLFPTPILSGSKGIAHWTYGTETYRQRARREEIFRAIGHLKRPRPTNLPERNSSAALRPIVRRGEAPIPSGWKSHLTAGRSGLSSPNRSRR